MPYQGIAAPSCPSRFFRRSRSNDLAARTSSNVSTSHTPTTHTSTLYVRSWPATLLGIALGFVTFFVLFEDVLMSGAKVTTDHVLTLAVLAIVATAGHMWWGQLRNLQLFTAGGLVLVFFAGLAYLVVASGGRNAEVMIAKRNAAHASNAERADRIAKIAEAEFILAPCPAGTPKQHIGERCSLRAVAIAECGSGKGTKCDGKTYSMSTYEAAIEGHRAALKKLPQLEENGALKSTARVMVAWQDAADPEKMTAEYVARLELLLPYVKALLVEIATIVFLAVGIGHRPSARAAYRETVLATVATPTATVAKQSPTAPHRLQPKAQLSRLATVAPSATVTQLRPTATVAATVAQSENLAMQLLQRTGTVAGQTATVAQEDIVQLFGGNKSRASRWLGKLEQEGTVARWCEGRNKFVQLGEQQSR